MKDHTIEISKLDAAKQVAMMRALRGRDEDVRVKIDELTAKDREIRQLQWQLEEAEVLTSCPALGPIFLTSVTIIITFKDSNGKAFKLV